MATADTHNKNLSLNLHKETHNMTSIEAGRWTKEKTDNLGNYLISLSENGTLTHEDVVSYVERIKALSENYSNKLNSDAGWEAQNARF